jgi:hypothetical protein
LDRSAGAVTPGAPNITEEFSGMDIQLNTLLVALMFVTILSMGIGNILVSLADIFNHATPSRREKVHIGWIFLMLLVHFNLFWHTKAILEVEDWEFGGFLLTMAGPVLMFFATSILLTDPPSDAKPDLATFFSRLGRRFFLMFALLQAWIVVVGYTMTGSFVVSDILNVGFFALGLFLASNLNERPQKMGIILAWGLGLGSFAVRYLANA